VGSRAGGTQRVAAPGGGIRQTPAMADPELTGRLSGFAAEFPTAADDLLEAVDDYLSSDPRDGVFSLIPEDERRQRIARLMNVRDVLRDAHDERGKT